METLVLKFQQKNSGMVELPSVRVLDLSENKVNNLEKIPECLKNLYHLNVCGNPIDVSLFRKNVFKFSSLVYRSIEAVKQAVQPASLGHL